MSDESSVIEIDGSFGEGGGQILRNSVSLAAILRKAIKIKRIRAARSKPGLKAQHIQGMKLCSSLCGGLLEGCHLGSSEVSYSPADMDQSGTPRTIFIGDTKTAGSICLILQAALPVAMFARKNPTTLILKGGTNASMAPPYDYWERVFLPILVEKFNVPGGLIHHTITRRGYFPKGGGEVRITTSPLLRPLDPIFMTQRGTISEISIRSYCAGSIPLQVATEMADSAKKILRQKNILVHPRIDIVREANAIGDGSGILIVAKTTTGCLLAGSALGETKKRGHVVGREAAEELIETIEDGGCVDEWLQDQLILFMALAKGESEILTGSLTLHTQTAIWVAQQLCGAVFEVERAAGDVVMRKDSSSVADAYGKDGRIPGKHLIRCSGIGYVNQQNQEPH